MNYEAIIRYLLNGIKVGATTILFCLFGIFSEWWIGLWFAPLNRMIMFVVSATAIGAMFYAIFFGKDLFESIYGKNPIDKILKVI